MEKTFEPWRTIPGAVYGLNVLTEYKSDSRRRCTDGCRLLSGLGVVESSVASSVGDVIPFIGLQRNWGTKDLGSQQGQY